MSQLDEKIRKRKKVAMILNELVRSGAFDYFDRKRNDRRLPHEIPESEREADDLERATTFDDAAKRLRTAGINL